MKFEKSLYIVCLFVVAQLQPVYADQLNGTVSESDFKGIGTSSESPQTSQGNHQLPSWFGVADTPTQQQASVAESQPAALKVTDTAQQIKDVQLKPQSTTDDTQMVDRPDWIPLHAYTNDHMLGLYGSLIPGLSLGFPISPRGQQVRLLKSITRFWHGGLYGSCDIWCQPVPEHPGNFIFGTIGNVNGPRGWLQDVKQTKGGRRLYRYWFDDGLRLGE